MTPRKLNLVIAGFPYGGTGSSSSLHPTVADWTGKAIFAAKRDERIDNVTSFNLSDTPITLTRNAAILRARALGADVLIMVDSDMAPDIELGHDPLAKPFFESSFDFLYDHYERGPCVICSPYCGPPPHENCYVFRWATLETGHPDSPAKLEAYSREEAAQLTGITPVAAQPTGLIMFDMRAFELTEPKARDPRVVLKEFKSGRIGAQDAIREIREQSWFYYEYPDCYQAEKASTEDVTATRDISLFGMSKLGYSPVYCNWQSWSGHWKSKCVGKPTIIHVDEISDKYQRAVILNRRSNQRLQAADSMQIGISTPKKDLKALHDLVKNIREGLARPITIVEVGSWIGTSSRAIASAMGEGSTLWCVDTWQGTHGDGLEITGKVASAYGKDRLFKTWERNVAEFGYPDRIFAVRGESVETAQKWELPLDIVFIDADHSYEAAKSDIKNWSKHLKPGGIIALHDYAVYEGVTRAVNELLPKFGRIGECIAWSQVNNGQATEGDRLRSEMPTASGSHLPSLLDDKAGG